MTEYEEQQAKTKAWRDALRVGDRVAIRSGYGRSWYVMKVVRRTPSQIVCGHDGDSRSEDRFWVENGRKVGRSHGYGTREIEPLTEEIAASIRRENDLSRVRYEKWESLPSDVLRAVCALLDEHEQKIAPAEVAP